MSQLNTIVFPGIANPIHAVATLTIGARADVTVITAQLQNGSPDTSGTSTMQLTFNGNTLTWINCLCDRGTKQITTHGHSQVYEVLDRRWAWRKNYASRAFNVRMDDGSIDPATLATVPQITTYLFGILGETVDVSAIDASENPEIVYDWDNVVDAIEELLLSRGYVIAPSMSSQNTAIYRRGYGATLPYNGDVISVTMSTNPPEVPYNLVCVCDKTLVQSMLQCQPVGLDTDGAWKPVNSLSYVPSGGWAGTDLEQMSMITDPESQDLALRTVGKCYQIVSQADGTFNLNSGGTNYCPGQIVVTSAAQYLPLANNLLQTATDPLSQVRYDVAYVQGTFYESVDAAQPPAQANTSPFTVKTREEYELDGQLGIVQFHKTQRKFDSSNNKMTFADVYLNCAYSIHPLTTYVKDRYYNTLTLGGIGVEKVERGDLNLTLIVNYTAGTGTVSSITTNLTFVQGETNNYLNNARYTYATQNGLVAAYRGLYSFGVDGVNLQIRWDVAAQTACPFATYVTQYNEGLPWLPTQRERTTIRRANMTPDPTQMQTRRFKRGRRKLDLKD